MGHTVHHEKYINKPGGVRVSNVERSSDQIIKPINVDALTSWVGFYDQDLLDDMDAVAPMLRKFGYDPDDSNPIYGVPDGEVKFWIVENFLSDLLKQTFCYETLLSYFVT